MPEPSLVPVSASTFLPADRLRRRCDPWRLEFGTTSDLPDIEEIIGQSRAVEALRFGVAMERPGYNLFALGPPGTGKRSLIERYLGERAREAPTPSDWCYVHDFATPHRPRALELPPGKGAELRSDMSRLVEDLQTSLRGAFESDEYRTRRQVIEEDYGARPEVAFSEIQATAKEKGLATIRTPVGVVFAPTRDGQPMSTEEFDQLPEEERKRIEGDVEALEQQFQQFVFRIAEWERDRRRAVQALDREVSSAAIGRLLGDLRRKYQPVLGVPEYLAALEKDVLEHAPEFLHPSRRSAEDGDDDEPGPEIGSATGLARYQVNLFIDRSGLAGAPVVFEDDPTQSNLVGRVEHLSRMGALVTDFRMIRPGALHRASGGFLILEARKLLLQPEAWEGLKRTLRSGKVRIESLAQKWSLVSTVSLEPEEIPLDVKIVLLGERWLYYLLASHDPEFLELFKVAVDFGEEMEWTEEGGRLYARLVATLARHESLLPLDAAAVSRVLEESARSIGDAARLSVRFAPILDLLREGDHFARQAGRTVVGAADVERAIAERVRRSDRVRERLLEEVLRETIRIEVDGEAVGQVNGLSVLQLGDLRFGHPARITARVRPGKGDVVDIEREVELGGPIHSKGVLILASFLGSRYAWDRPLALRASLVFEQSYSGVEGDSASSAELYALLSAISGVPIRQSFAVTGSVDQTGRVQAIGGVNEKIEGFFDLCARRGLSGRQGVLVPRSNVQHLMLRQDVVEAVAAGRFQVHAVSTIDEGIELLTGLTAGVPDASGAYPAGTVNERVTRRLTEMAARMTSFARTDAGREP